MTSKPSNITEPIAWVAAQAARVAAQDMAVATADKSQTTQNVASKIGGPIMKQPTFDWEANDKYSELNNTI